MKVKTFIRKTPKGHTVCFTIGIQTFQLSECEKEGKRTSLYFARWHKKMLDSAFKHLTGE